MSGRPPLRWIGRWVDRRVGPGARGLTLTGAGRPLDGGRGRTCACRWSRRVVIGRIVARRGPTGPAGARPIGRVAHSPMCGAMYSGAVGRVTTHRRVRPEIEGEACRLAIRVPGDGRPVRTADPSSAWGRSRASRPSPASTGPARPNGLPAMPAMSRPGFGLPNLRRNVCPHFYMTGSRGRDPDPGAAPAQGPDPPGHQHVALPAARRRPHGAGLRQRRVPHAALQPVRLLRGRADPRVTVDRR